MFDLDGTLLPMDLTIFLDAYFSLLLNYLAQNGYDYPKAALATQNGIKSMMSNDGSLKNEDAFWKAFASVYGHLDEKDVGVFEAFYREEFSKLKEVCGFDARAVLCVNKARMLANRILLATNPVYPRTATEQRAEWAGCPVSLFDDITTFENSSFSKPNLNYYTEILEKKGLKPEECLMIGNDVGDDMVAARLGMKVFLLTPCLINKENTPIEVFPHGDFDDLLRFLDTL
jgi:FMN phosphatase YigB (HAD superfamily)